MTGKARARDELPAPRTGQRSASPAQIAKRRARFLALCESLPDVWTEGDQHLSIRVGKKRFGYYLDDHHGDGRIALHCKAPPGEQLDLVEFDPEIFHVPAYLGAKGWIGVWLDLRKVDWKAVQRRLEAAYRMTAKRRQIAELEAGR